MNQEIQLSDANPVASSGLNLSLLKTSTIAQVLAGLIITITVVTTTAVAVTTFTLTVKYDYPVANPDSAVTWKKVALPVYVLSNDNDPRQAPLTVTAVTKATYGVVKISQDGKFVIYTSNPGYAGLDTFNYTVMNDKLSSSAKVTITVKNHEPFVFEQHYQLQKNSINNKLDIFNYKQPDSGFTFSDDDGDTLYLVSCTQPLNGVIQTDDFNVYYIPNKFFNGLDSANCSVTDKNATVSFILDLTIINSPPVANPDFVSAPKNTFVKISVLDNDFDINNDELNVTWTGNVAQGNARVSTDHKFVEYIPAFTTASSTDSLEYQCSDGFYDSSSYVVINLINNPPQANDISKSVAKNTNDNLISLVQCDITTPNAPFDYCDTDIGESLTISVKQQDPFYGSFSVVASEPVNVPVIYGNGEKFIQIPKVSYSLKYTPKHGFTGTDVLLYTVTDSGKLPTTSKITIKVTNTAPVAPLVTASCSKRNSVTLNVLINAYDPDGDQIVLNSIQPIAGVTKGTITQVGSNQATYTAPANGFTGNDTFNYFISDVQLNPADSLSATGIVSINVFNEPPVPVDDTGIIIQKGITANIDVLANDYDPNRDAISVNSNSETAQKATTNIVTVQKNGNSVTQIAYTSLNSVYQDSFTYDIKDEDGMLSTKSAKVSLSIVNTPPVAFGDTASLFWNSTVTIDVLANDTDANPGDKAILRINSVSTTSNGGSVDNQGTSLVYTPKSGFVGIDTFTYTCKDQYDNSNSATVTVTVINNPPVAVNDAYTRHALVPTIDMDVLANDYDPQNDPIALVSVSGTSKAQIVTSGGKTVIRYTSAPYVGTETFTYTITDYQTTASATVTVTSNDQAPIANPDSLSIKWRNTAPQTINVLANDVDPDGDTIVITSVSVPNGFQGSLVQSGNTLVYTAPGNWAGTQTATYTISDLALTATGVVTINVLNTYVPSAPAVSFTSHWRTQTTGTTVTLLTSLYDQDQDPLTLTIGTIAAPASVSINADAMSVLYKHASWTGTESFSYTISDGLASATGTVTATVYNNPPVTPALTATVAPNKRTSGILINVLGAATDPDSADFPYLSLYSFSTSTQATISLDPTTGYIKYVPNAINNAFVDSFTYTVSDGLTTSTGTVTVTVQYAAPSSNSVFQDVLWNVQKNTPPGLVFTVASSGNTVQSVSTQATQGTCTVVSGTSIRYAQNTNYIGADTCTLSFTDTNGATGSIFVYLNVYDNAPTATSFTFSTQWRTLLTTGASYNVLAGSSDSDSGDAVSLRSSTSGQLGTTTANNPSAGYVLYRANSAFLGSDSFTYTATDGLLTVTRPVTINSINAHKPTASIITQSIHWRTLATNGLSITIMASATDADGDTLTITVGTGSQGGVLAVNGLSVSYSHSSWIGTETFAYTVSDGIQSASSTITVTVTDTAPVANNDAYTFLWRLASSGLSLAVKLNDSDANSDPISITRVSVPSLGGSAVKQADDTILYSAKSSTVGVETFSYAISDTIIESSATVTITLFDTAPVTSNLVATTKWNTPLSGVVASCTDADADPLTIALLTYPKYGTLSNTVYTPDTTKLAYTLTPDTDGKYKVVDQFSFTCTDTIASSTGFISITVYNTPPTARTDYYTFQRNIKNTSPYQLAVMLNDTDADGDTISLSTFSASNGAALSSSNNVINYTPVSTFAGTETITYSIYDGNLFTTGAAYVSMLNSPPACNNIVKTGLLKGTKYRWYLATEAACSDANNDVLNFAVPTPNTYTKGVVNTGSDSTGFYVEYTPNLLRSQADSITFTVSDGFVTISRTITIGISNRSPTTTSFSTSLIYKSTTTVLSAWNVMSSVTDPDLGDSVAITSISQGNCSAAGTLAIVSGSVQFTQKGGYGPGSCTFSYNYSDKDQDYPITVTATGFISISGLANPPVAVPDSFTFNQGANVLIAVSDLLKNDYDIDNNTFVFDYIVCRYNYTCTKSWTMSSDGLYISIPWNGDDMCGTIYYEYQIRTPIDNQISIAMISISFINCKCASTDICFVIDGTSTVTSAQWIATKNFIKNMVYLFINNPASLTGSAADKVAVCVIQYSQIAEDGNTRGFGLTQSEGAVYKNIDALVQYNLATRYEIGGINLAKTDLLTGHNIRKRVVLISYGVPNYPCSCTDCSSVYGSTNQNQCSIPSIYPSLTCKNSTWDIVNYPNSAQYPQKWCAPSADPTTIATNINNTPYWRVISIASGSMPQLGINELQASAYNSQTFFNVPNLDPSVMTPDVQTRIVDAICGTTKT